MAKASYRCADLPRTVFWTSAGLLVVLAFLLSLRSLTEVDVFGCLQSSGELSVRCPFPKGFLFSSLVSTVAASSEAGLGFSMLCMVLTQCAVLGIVVVGVIEGISVASLVIASYCWLLMSEWAWGLAYPILLLPLVSWLLVLGGLSRRGRLPPWSWSLFFGVWTLFCGPVLGWILLVLTAPSRSVALRSLGWAVVGGGMVFLLSNHSAPLGGLLWPLDGSSFFARRSLLDTSGLPVGLPTAAHRYALVVALILTIFVAFVGKRHSLWQERIAFLLMVGLTVADVRMISCLAPLATMQWAQGLSSIVASRRIFRHVRMHVWFLPLLIGLDIARTVTNTKYIAEERADRWGIGVDPLAIPVNAARWFTAKNIDGDGLMDPSVKLIVEWQRLASKQHEGYEADRRAVVYSNMTREAWSGQLQRFSYLLLSHRNSEEQELLLQVAQNPSWKLTYADYFVAHYVRVDGPYGSEPELKVGRVLSPIQSRSMIVGIEPNWGMRERIARWLWLREAPPEAAFYFGKFLLMSGHAMEALDPLLVAAAQSPNFLETSLALGVAFEELGSAEGAERSFGRYLLGNGDDRAVRRRFIAASNMFDQELEIDDVPAVR